MKKTRAGVIEMLILDGKQVAERLSAGACTAVMREALAGLARGEARQYLRTVTPLPTGNLMGYMPAFLGEDYFGAKLITVFHTNQGTAHPSHQGSVLLFDTAHGELLAMMDGNAITAIRTGAVSAVATDLLALPGADTLCLLGAGEQARSHLAAIASVRPLRQVRVWDLYPQRADCFVEKLQASYPGVELRACATAREAVEGADILCTLTPSKTPVLERSWVKPGAHINAVGACAATDRELPSDLVAAARLYCDAYESIQAESGDFLYPKREGLIDDSHILGSIGELLLGRAPGRQSAQDITLFEALGLAVEDVACAKFLYEGARNANTRGR